MDALRVIRFRNTGVREQHALALCEPCHEDSSVVRVVYADYEVKCEAKLLVKAIQVDVSTMLNKAHVLLAVERDCDALASKLSHHKYVSARAPPPARDADHRYAFVQQLYLSWIRCLMSWNELFVSYAA